MVADFYQCIVGDFVESVYCRHRSSSPGSRCRRALLKEGELLGQFVAKWHSETGGIAVATTAVLLSDFRDV
ncbi:hypothetical protein D3C78_1920390 [compost metagenome]